MQKNGARDDSGIDFPPHVSYNNYYKLLTEPSFGVFCGSVRSGKYKHKKGQNAP